MMTHAPGIWEEGPPPPAHFLRVAGYAAEKKPFFPLETGLPPTGAAV